MNANINKTANTETVNSPLEKFTSEFATGFAEGLEKTLKREQMRQDIIFYGKIALGVAAVAGIGLVVYRNWNNEEFQIVDAKDL